MSLASYRFLLLMAMWLENEPMRTEKWRPGGDEFGYGYEKGWKVAPVSIEDRTVVGSVDRV